MEITVAGQRWSMITVKTKKPDMRKRIPQDKEILNDKTKSENSTRSPT
jgi:hypothetical protein